MGLMNRDGGQIETPLRLAKHAARTRFLPLRDGELLELIGTGPAWRNRTDGRGGGVIDSSQLCWELSGAAPRVRNDLLLDG